MTDYVPFGSLLLADRLATDPFGTVHRGLELEGPHRGRNVLVRRYHPHWIEAGLLKNVPEIQRNVLHLGKLKLFQDDRLVREPEPHFVWPLCQGRSLRRVLEESEAQQVPFGLDQALFLAWILCHHIGQLHQAGLALGFLTPDRIWIGFDGVVELLDAPVIQQMEQVVEQNPSLRALVSEYLVGPTHEGIARDAYQVGALLYQMLTHRALPEPRYLARELGNLMILGPEGKEKLPSSIATLMTRLLGLGRSYHMLEELEKDLEESLFGNDDFNPSTFGLAFTLHTLFRQEIEAETAAIEQEQSEDGILACSLAVKSASPARTAPKRASSGLRFGLSAATVFLAGAGALWAWKKEPRPLPLPVVQTAEPLATPSLPVPPPARSHDAEATATPEPKLTPKPTPAPTASALPTPHPSAVPTPLPLKVSPDATGTARLLTRPSIQGGPVKLRVFVDEQGRVRQAFVLEGASKGTDRERQACQLAMSAHFTPAMDHGKPIRDWAELSLGR